MLADFPVTTRPSDERLLDDFAQVVSHRIRNLLAGIEGFTDLLADTLGSREQRELALRILESTARIEVVLADLQHYSRPVHGVPLPVCVQDVLERLLAALDEHQRSALTLDVSERQRKLLADPVLLQQALLTLIHNALEACPAGPSATLRVAFDPHEQAIRFDVCNPGTIALDRAAQQVFEPFFTTKPQNLGIGLSIARRIAEAHGGRLYLAANDPARGTCFRLALPAPAEARKT